MSLASVSTGGDAPETAVGWRFLLASVATPRTLAVVTAFAATLGLLPLYDSVWWWDLLTHALSGAVITGWLFVAGWRVTGVVALVAVLSGAWELAEFVTPNYVFVAGGAADTALDVVCNFAGAAVAGAALRFFAVFGEGRGRAATGTNDSNGRSPAATADD